MKRASKYLPAVPRSSRKRVSGRQKRLSHGLQSISRPMDIAISFLFFIVACANDGTIVRDSFQARTDNDQRLHWDDLQIVASAFIAPPQIHAPVLNRETGNLRVQSVPLPRSRGSASTRNDSNRHLFSVELPWPTPDPSFEVPLVTGRPFFAHRLCELFQCVCLTGVMKSDENPSSIIPEHRFFPHGVNHSPMLG